MKKILVVIAHPDDEILGCGGFLKKKAAENVECHVLYMNNGNLRAGYDRSVIKDQIFKVADLLGFTPHIEKFYNCDFDMYPQSLLAETISAYVKRLQPDTVMTHIGNDLHQDHLLVYSATMIAVRYMPNSPVKNVLTFPTISSSEINPSFDFRADAIIDISDYVNDKIQAMAFYEYEQNAFQELRGTEGIKGWGRFYGMQISVPYAEGFRVERIVL
jgi:LmbE family N-acetylglucosaminyl deacetylase